MFAKKEVKKVEAAKPVVKKAEVKVEAKTKPAAKKPEVSDKQRINLLERKVASIEKRLEAKKVAAKKK